MKARPRRRHLLAAGLITGLFAFLLGPATPAAADDCPINNPLCHLDLGDLIQVCLIEECEEQIIHVPCPDDVVGILLVRVVFDPCEEGPHGELIVAHAGTGSGIVTSNDGSFINCGSLCERLYTGLTQVTLTATPGTGSSFTGWTVTGDATKVSGCDGTGPCTLLLRWEDVINGSWNTYVTATFNAGGTIAAASVGPLCHFHQHGGAVTGPGHHLVFHVQKHAHRHCHPGLPAGLSR